MQSKYQVIKAGVDSHLFNEIELMADLDHPFILQLNSVAQDQRVVVMYLEYMKCGDLIGGLRKFKRFPLSHVRFITAQLVLALEHLHSKSLIYRDLKPENILIGDDGCIKLADFGFIKRLAPWERTYTFCGTPEYMAPEIIAGGGYAHSVDFWALGIMMFELLYGRPPFVGADPMDIFK